MWLTRTARLMSVIALLGVSADVRASSIDALIAKLAGDDEVARSEARQLLPREDTEAVRKVVPLVAGDKDAVWRAAFNVICDFAAEVSMPGREAERAAVAGYVMQLVSPEQPEAVKVRGLRLLSLAVPPGYDVAPIAVLLGDATLREKARACLQEMGTPEARAALRAAVKRSPPAFQCALLQGLAQLKDAESLSLAKELAGSDDAQVRAAAALVLAWTGDPRHLDIVRKVANTADDATRADAADALVRLLDAMAVRGGNWQIVVSTYLELLPKMQGVYQDAVLAGLGRIGDGTCVRPVLDAIRQADNPTRLVGVDALRSMQGVDVTRALMEAYPRLDPAMQLAIIPVLGEKKHGLAMPILVDAATSTNPEFRMAAISALGVSGQAEGIDPLVAAARGGSAEEKARAAVALLEAADGLQARHQAKDAGTAYLAAYTVAGGTMDIKRHALAGLAACAVPEAYEAVTAAAAEKELREPAIPALLAVAESLAGAKQNDKALQAYETLRKLEPPMSVMQSVAKGMHALGAKVNLPELLGTITHWWVVGPFELGEQNKGWDTAYIGEPGVSLSARYMSGKTRVNWNKVVSADANGKIDLRKTVADRDSAIAYAYTEITVREDIDAVLLVGVDDSERIWLNGQKVFELWVPRGLTPDQDRVPVKLKAGNNTILMKIWQNTLGWEFCMRVATPDGRPVSFTQQ